jgi:hypothetical protein
MRIQHIIALAVAVGLGLGVIATRGLAAQAKRTFYVVIEVDEITDAEWLQSHDEAWSSEYRGR